VQRPLVLLLQAYDVEGAWCSLRNATIAQVTEESILEKKADLLAK
jgi:hypothetical protein